MTYFQSESALMVSIEKLDGLDESQKCRLRLAGIESVLSTRRWLEEPDDLPRCNPHFSREQRTAIKSAINNWVAKTENNNAKTKGDRVERYD